MRSWIVLVAVLVVLSGFSVMGSSLSPKAGEVLHTDKSVYVIGERMKVSVHGENSTVYILRVDNFWIDTFTTNSTGYYTGYYDVLPGNHLGVGTHEIELELRGNIVAKKSIEVREGLQLWPSDYTHSTDTYLSGETMWVKLMAESNREYKVNITNSSGALIYPSSGAISVTTDDEGMATFSIKLDFGDDDYSINLYNGTNYIQSRNFEIRSVEVSVTLDKGTFGVYLLSEKIHAYVTVYWLKSRTPIKNAQYKWWIVDASNSSITFGPYMGSGNEFDTYTLKNYETGTGDVIESGKMYFLKVEYMNTNATGRHYDETSVLFYTGYLSASMDMSALDSSISPGKKALITISTYASSGGLNSPLGNVHVDYINITITKYWNVLWYHNYTDYGYTDIAGKAYMIWDIPDVEDGSMINITARVTIYGEHYTVYYTTHVIPAVGFKINLDRKNYLAGDTMSIYLHATAPSGIEVTGYSIWITAQRRVLYYTTTSDDTVTYTLPTNFSGTVKVMAIAYFSDGDVMSDHKYANVYYGYIYLSASQTYFFKAGDEITIYTDFSSHIMHPATLLYKIMDDRDTVIMEMNASLDKFTFRVPDGDSEYYKITAEATDGSYFAANTLTIYRFEGYELNVHMVSKSRYQSMVFEPGETIKIAYNITKYGEFEPHVIVLHWTILNTNYHWEKVLSPDEMSGTVDIKLPGDLRGGYALEFWVTDADDHDTTFSVLTVNVEKGSWAMQDIAGMPLLSLINLVLVIVAVVIGVIAILMLRGGKGTKIIPEIPKKTKKKGAPKPYSPEGKTEEEPSGEAPPSKEESPAPNTEDIEEIGEL